MSELHAFSEPSGVASVSNADSYVLFAAEMMAERLKSSLPTMFVAIAMISVVTSSYVFAGRCVSRTHIHTQTHTHLLSIESLSHLEPRCPPCSWEGQAVARLPFEPWGFVSSLTHRGLAGTDLRECSALFFYILSAAFVRTNLHKYLGIAPAPPMFGTDSTAS